MNIICTHCLKHVERHDGILLQIFMWMLSAKTNISIGSHVVDKIATGHRLGQLIFIDQVAFNEGETILLKSAINKPQETCGKIVIRNNVMTLGKKTINKVTADKSGSSSNEIAHIFIL